MAFTGPIEDRLAIRELYDTYADVSSRGDVEGWLACFTDDGQWNSHIFRCVGPAELRAQWDQVWANFAKVGFLGQVGSIEVDGDTATCRSVAREVISLKSGGVYKLIGTYDDRIVRRHGQWLFARRDYAPLVEEPPA
jgi:ketosteroid isomerase-like protein